MADKFSSSGETTSSVGGGNMPGTLDGSHQCDQETPSTSDSAAANEESWGSSSKRLRKRSETWPSWRRVERNFLARTEPRTVKKRNTKYSPLVDYSVSYALANKCLLKRCANWNFDSFFLSRVTSGHPVISLGSVLFEAYDLRRHFQLDWTKLINCFRLVELGYEGNLFHNAIHAADVMQAMHCLLQDERLIDCLSPFEKLLCLMAALGHDLYHPGVNQNFLCRTQHFLSGLYESSVLENHHWRCFVSLLKESHLFDHFSNERWQELIDVLKVLILSTDMQRQQEYLASFKLFLKTEKSTAIAAGAASRKLMQIVLKCADISNVARPRGVSKLWSPIVTMEFFKQGDEERRLGLSVTEFCDRTKSTVAEIQWGFMEHLAAPLFNSWAEFIGSPLSHQMILCLRENQSYWKSQLEDRQKLVDNSVDQEKTEEQAHGKAKGHRDHSGSRSRTPKANRRISLPAQNGSYINDSRGKQRRISLPICYYGAAVTKWSVMLKGERNFQDLCEIESFDQRNEVDIQQATPPPPISLPLCSLTCNHESTAVGPILRVSHSVGEFVSQKTTELTKKMSSSSFAVLDDIYESGCSPKSDCFDCRMDTTGETPVVNLNTVPDGKLRKCRRHSAPVLFQPNGLWRIYVDSRQTDSTPPNVKLTASTGVCASDVCSDEWKWCRQGRRSSAPIATAPISASATKSTEISSSNHNPSESNGDHLVTAVG